MQEIEWLSPADIPRVPELSGPVAVVADLRDPAMQPLLALRPTPSDLADERRPGASARKWFMRRRSALRSLAALYLGCAGEDVVIGYDGPGAPRLRAPASCSVSVSGRGPYAALALAKRPVGIDIEIFDTGIEVVEDILRPDERAALAELDGEAQRRHFLRIWTAKEAFLKALGTGLNIEPANVAVEFEEGASVSVRYAQHCAQGALRAFQFADAEAQGACVVLA